MQQQQQPGAIVEQQQQQQPAAIMQQQQQPTSFMQQQQQSAAIVQQQQQPAANTQHQPSAELVRNTKQNNKYCVKYQNNNSKRWDGREIRVDSEYLESLYDPSLLVPGFEVSIPWKGKNTTTHWKAVIVDLTTSKTMYTTAHIII